MEEPFIFSLLLIIGIDLLLGGDNAIIIALACRNLPEEQRKKGILFGTLLAICCRILLTTLAVHLLKIPFLEFAGGVLLLFIASSLLTRKGEEHTSIKSHHSLRKAIQTIVLADLFMGLDNVIAVAGAAGGNVLLVVIGLVISIPVIILGSKFMISAMSRFPSLIYAGGAILAFTAGRMMVADDIIGSFFGHGALQQGLPYLTSLLILFYALLCNMAKKTT